MKRFMDIMIKGGKRVLASGVVLYSSTKAAEAGLNLSKDGVKTVLNKVRPIEQKGRRKLMVGKKTIKGKKNVDAYLLKMEKINGIVDDSIAFTSGAVGAGVTLMAQPLIKSMVNFSDDNWVTDAIEDIQDSIVEEAQESLDAEEQ